MAINSQLDVGSTGSDVQALQNFLVSQGYMTQAQVNTGYGTYGPQTTAAVQAYQRANGIVSSGDAASTGYGRVGPQTLASINSKLTPVQSTPAPVYTPPAYVPPVQTQVANSTPAYTPPVQTQAPVQQPVYVPPAQTYTPPAQSNVSTTTPAYTPPVTQTQTPVTPAAPALTSTTTAYPIASLQPGATGVNVQALQDFLVANGFMTQAQVNTGYGTYGPQTEAAVLALQQKLGVDNSSGPGYYGPKTIAAIQGAVGLNGALTNAGASSSQANTLSNGSTNPTTGSTGLPNNMGSTLGVNGPVLGSVDANNLNSTTLGTILPSLAANSAAANLPVSSTLAGIIALINQPNSEDAQIQQLNTQIASMQASMGNEGTDFQNALNAAGVPQYQAQLNDLNAQIAQLQGTLGTFDAETQQGLANITGQAIPQDLLYGQASAYQTQRDATRTGLASQLAANASLQQAYSNNLQTAEQLAQTSVTLKWQGVSNQLDLLQKQLSIYQSEASTEDTKNTNIVNVLLQQQQNLVTAQQKTDSDIASLTVQAASAGAPLAIINQMRAATDATTAAFIGAQYLKGAAETTAQLNQESGTTTSTASGSSGVEIRSGNLVYTKDDYSQDSQKLDKSRGPDNYVDPNVYLNLYNGWIALGGSLEDFLKEFPPKNYINPANTWLPSYLMPPKASSSSAADLFNSL